MLHLLQCQRSQIQNKTVSLRGDDPDKLTLKDYMRIKKNFVIDLSVPIKETSRMISKSLPSYFRVKDKEANSTAIQVTIQC